MYELTKARRPARAKALIINAFALAGVNGYVVCIHTQGVATLALGFALVGLSAHSA